MYAELGAAGLRLDSVSDQVDQDLLDLDRIHHPARVLECGLELELERGPPLLHVARTGFDRMAKDARERVRGLAARLRARELAQVRRTAMTDSHEEGQARQAAPR